jgi:HSP20 family protein
LIIIVKGGMMMFGINPYRRNSGIIKKNNDAFDIERFFESFFNDPFFPTFSSGGSQIKVDIKENDMEYIVEAELPGVSREEITVDLKDDRLTIAVERNEQINVEKENYIRRERKYGSMSRTFSVPNIIREKASAKFENGILSIILPKRDHTLPGSSKIQIE